MECCIAILQLRQPSLHFLPMSVLVFSGFSGFLPPPKNMLISEFSYDWFSFKMYSCLVQ